jgi:hypothetical protein
MQPQIRIRKMRQRRPSSSRSTDGIRQTYHDQDVRAARIARDRELRLRENRKTS